MAARRLSLQVARGTGLAHTSDIMSAKVARMA